ncbi:haloacid dehalogenase type II [Pseudonocardia sp. DLS-67]
MSAAPIVEPPGNRPAGHRAVPLLAEPDVGHYPEFRDFLTGAFDTADAPGLLSVDGRFYELVFTGRSGRPFPAGVEIHALVAGLEPLDEQVADRDLWAIMEWVVGGVGGEWTVDALRTTGRIYRVPAVAPAEPPPPASGGEALVFDLYGTLVDPLAISAELEAAMSRADAQRVARVWRRTQLEYTFRLTVMGRYEDFAWVTERSLEFALRECGCELGPRDRVTVLSRYDVPEPFPDAVPALEALAGRGHRMAVLSNGSRSMLRDCLAASGLREHVPVVISVDAVRAYKPHPAVYRLAAETLGHPIDGIRLVSSNPFDIVGASEAGMRTAWANRAARPFDTLGTEPDITVTSLAELPALLDEPDPEIM